MTVSRRAARPSTQLPRKEPLQPPPQPATIAHLLCCGAKHLYIDTLSTAAEPTGLAQRQIR
jgi:hypothetical protein